MRTIGFRQIMEFLRLYGIRFGTSSDPGVVDPKSWFAHEPSQVSEATWADYETGGSNPTTWADLET